MKNLCKFIVIGLLMLCITSCVTGEEIVTQETTPVVYVYYHPHRYYERPHYVYYERPHHVRRSVPHQWSTRPAVVNRSHNRNDKPQRVRR